LKHSSPIVLNASDTKKKKKKQIGKLAVLKIIFSCHSLWYCPML